MYSERASKPYQPASSGKVVIQKEMRPMGNNSSTTPRKQPPKSNPSRRRFLAGALSIVGGAYWLSKTRFGITVEAPAPKAPAVPIGGEALELPNYDGQLNAMARLWRKNQQAGQA
jgi:hypothetical protein